MKTDFKFNFNEWVKVRLKRRGIDILEQRHAELNAAIKARGGRGLDPFSVKIDSEGYTKFQLWDLMKTFGDQMIMGYEPPFHGDMIFCGGEAVEITEPHRPS